MKNVDIALLIWQRNRVSEVIGRGPDTVVDSPLANEAWEGIVQVLDSIIDEAIPKGSPLPPPYRPWHTAGLSKPSTTRECLIDYIDSNGGLAETHPLWAEYSEYCREAGVDPLTKET